MRHTILAAIAAAISIPALASAGTVPRQDVSLQDAGEAATFGVWVCGIPPSSIDAFVRRLNEYRPGASGSAEFLGAQAEARRTLDDIRQAGGGTDELKSSRCDDINALVHRVASAN